MADNLFGHPSPIEQMLGLTFDEHADGRTRGRLSVTEQLFSRAGRMHGGLIFTAVDTVMGMATRKAVGMDRMVATIDVSIRFIRSVAAGELTILVSVVHPGRTVVHLAAEVVDERGKLVATATGAFLAGGDRD